MNLLKTIFKKFKPLDVYQMVMENNHINKLLKEYEWCLFYSMN
jgi:hypothetical protein